MLKNKNKGFSLLELVVTVGIMAVLAGVLIPSMVTASNDSRQKSDDAAMQHLTELYKSATQEHQAYYYFSRAMELLDEGEKEVYFWYDIDANGNVTYRAMNLKYPDNATAATINDINVWASQYKDRANDYIKGSYEIPQMESKNSFKKCYVIAVTATEREYLVNVKGDWE